MATKRFTNGPIGAGPTRRTTFQEHTPGSVANGDDKTVWVYQGPAQVAVAAGAAEGILDSSFRLAAGVGYTPETAVAVGEYGWVRKTASPF